MRALDPHVIPSRNPLRVEAVVGAAVALALAKDEPPVEARLRAFEEQHLEDVAVVVRGDAPLAIVVVDIERVVPDPGAPHRLVHPGKCAASRIREEAASSGRKPSTGPPNCGRRYACATWLREGHPK